MLGKLLKYEFKSMGRILPLIYIAVVVCGIIIGLFMRPYITGGDYYTEDLYTTSSGWGLIVSIYMFLLIALVVLTMILIIYRFYKNLLCGEGYLMHTLPVPTWTLVAGKVITAFVWSLIGVAVAAISAVCIMYISGSMAIGSDTWADYLAEGSSDSMAFIGLGIVAVLLAIIATILCFYVSMAIGNLANRHKFALAVLAFIILSIIIAIINTAVCGGAENAGGSLSLLYVGMLEDTSDAMFRILLIKGVVINLIQAVVCFVLTTLILHRKLNLE